MIISLKVKGAVQGIGYRPFISQKAKEYSLKGMVRNIGAAVEILVSGKENDLADFVNAVKTQYPAGAFILDVQKTVIPDDMSFSYDSFVIEDSIPVDLSDELAVFSPDIGICNDCLEELLDPNDRRYRYPLISCASCGPRISIANSLPYDRDTTTMEEFDMCPVCRREYVSGRRMHAQTISCHECGPQMLLAEYKAFAGSSDIFCRLDKDEAVKRAVDILKSGGIIGLKGISGYQLLCIPNDDTARRLRSIKGREAKPFAVMFGTAKEIKEYAFVNSKEEELLKSSARPIVLLKRKEDFPKEVIKASDYIGAFLPSTGVHKLLCDAVGPLIATSANKSDMPMIIDDEAFCDAFMPKKADSFDEHSHVDAFLYHERKINMAQDDSVMFVCPGSKGREVAHFVRRARGYAPLPVLLNKEYGNCNVLALGGDLKSVFAFGKKDKIMPSQYIGDLEDYDVFQNFDAYIERFEKFYHFTPDVIIRDMHPLYISHSYADKKSAAYDKKIKILDVQHHHAHALSVMAEHSLNSCIGVCFDGTGYGTDNKIWGGEFLLCKGTDFKRLGRLSYVKLCGGKDAPRKASLVSGCYEEALGIKALDDFSRAALKNNINIFETSSMGRLFDAVCALLDINKLNSYEGECAMLLEKAAYSYSGEYPHISFDILDDKDMLIADQLMLYNEIKKIVEESNYSVEAIAYSFHMAIVKLVLDICIKIRKEHDENKVCLSGGVFLNRILLKECIKVLEENEFEVYVNEAVPSGDGCISLGQAYYGLMMQDI